MCPSDALAATRIKDITIVQGIRDNQLVGYGLVIGLAGTGDSFKNSPFTEQSMRSMLRRMGVGVEPGSMKSKNVAAVAVTSTLPPFVAEGSRLDVEVSSLGDASSLIGGILVMTPLIAADGEAYAVAQGPLHTNAIAASGQAASVTKGVPTSARIPNGAIIEKDHTADINQIGSVNLVLQNADFKSATNIADVINAYAKKRYKTAIAQEKDYRTVVIQRPKDVMVTRLIAEIGELQVEADINARIVIDEKNGTIVIGSNVRILPVAVAHGSMMITVTEEPRISQPEPLSDGVTAVEPSTTIEVTQENGPVAVLNGPTLGQLVSGLNQMGLKPPDILAILQSIKASGALQAELVVR
ncbi:MAG: flagellar basal body P-ring protein FlgI [Aestuariivirga sp.]